MRRSIVWACVAAAVLAACGSTVPDSQAINNDSSEFDAGVVARQGELPADTAVSGDDTDTTAGPSQAGSRGRSRSAPTTTAALAQVGRGVTSSTLTIGIPSASGVDNVATLLGVSGAETLATKDIVAAVVDDVNKT